MTEEQIKSYEMCKSHLQAIETWKKDISFNFQKYGCGRNALNIEHNLEKIHNEMYNTIISSFSNAKDKIQNIVEKL
jgi:hypothetical protein